METSAISTFADAATDYSGDLTGIVTSLGLVAIGITAAFVGWRLVRRVLDGVK